MTRPNITVSCLVFLLSASCVAGAKFLNDLDDACSAACDNAFGTDCTRTQCSGKNTLKCKYMYYTTKDQTDVCYAYDDVPNSSCPELKYKVKCHDELIAEELTATTTCSEDKKGNCKLGPIDMYGLLNDSPVDQTEWDDSMADYKTNFMTCYDSGAIDQDSCEAVTIDTSAGNSYSCSWIDLEGGRSGCYILPFTQSLIAYENGKSTKEKKGELVVDQTTVFGLYTNLAEICQASFDPEADQSANENACSSTKLTEVFSNWVKCTWDQDVADAHVNGCTPKLETVFGEAKFSRYLHDAEAACEELEGACPTSTAVWFLTYVGKETVV